MVAPFFFLLCMCMCVYMCICLCLYAFGVCVIVELWKVVGVGEYRRTRFSAERIRFGSFRLLRLGFFFFFRCVWLLRKREKEVEWKRIGRVTISLDFVLFLFFDFGHGMLRFGIKSEKGL